jgi:quercetin dioxygenase-like cupin family protein
MNLVHAPSREAIQRLQNEMVKLPQVEGMITDHYFNGGMYCRKLTRKAGTLIVGRTYKTDHFYICVSGEIIAWSEKGMVRLQAGDIIESKAGTKRVTLAVKDSIGITLHKTDKTDFDELEAELMEPEEGSMYNFDNSLKQQVLNHVSATAPMITKKEA